MRPASLLAIALLLQPAGSSTTGLPSWTHLLREQSHELWSRHAARREAGPAVGALYVGAIHMPIIGMQTFMLKIVSRHRARIILVGHLNLDEPASYAGPHDGTGAVDIEFNEPTQDLLRRWKTRIRSVSYWHDDDTCQLEISPPLIPAIRVLLRRDK